MPSLFKEQQETKVVFWLCQDELNDDNALFEAYESEYPFFKEAIGASTQKLALLLPLIKKIECEQNPARKQMAQKMVIAMGEKILHHQEHPHLSSAYLVQDLRTIIALASPDLNSKWRKALNRFVDTLLRFCTRNPSLNSPNTRLPTHSVGFFSNPIEKEAKNVTKQLKHSVF